MKRLILAVSIGFLVGWFAKDITGAENVRAAAPKAPSYMVRALQGSNVEVLENSLNTQSQNGWRLHSFSGGVLIFER